MMLQYGALMVVCLLAAILYPAYRNYKKCDLNNPNNRNFKAFYGLENSFIPFGKYNAELNTKTLLFTPIIKENIDAASIIVVGEFGAGKTHIRNYRIDQYDKRQTHIIELIKQQKPTPTWRHSLTMASLSWRHSQGRFHQYQSWPRVGRSHFELRYTRVQVKCFTKCSETIVLSWCSW